MKKLILSLGVLSALALPINSFASTQQSETESISPKAGISMYSIYGPYDPYLEGFINYAYVTADELNVRYAPINGTVIESLSYGTKVKVQSMKMIDGKAWVYIAYNHSGSWDGRGWVSFDYLKY
ncbi:SH3 domain-containing protein [Paraclostridium bifermentans]|uniref:SH3 domain-containing protein n=1 Tax=Paraclostridium bifermentans TaxID=1490 RepID=UPI001897C88C|nr:SH3 domain-containing protein [Paraclostridium bifermentans]